MKENFNDASYIHRNTVYIWIGGIWLSLMITFGYFIFKNGIFPTFYAGHPIMGWLEIINFSIFTNLFFWFSVQNIIFPMMYHHIKKTEAKHEQKILSQPLPADWRPKVDLLYTTYNDFIPSALDECSHQTWPNTQVIILDNSTDKDKIRQIREYVHAHPGTKWIRDVPNHHAKAGNLDNFLCHEGKDTYDYFVILDSDELLQPDFVEKCLHFFYFSDYLGILQCNHISGRNMNQFMDTFSHAGNTFWPVQNSVRSSTNGYLRPKTKLLRGPKTLRKGECTDIGLGHGVMVSRECFDAIGKFPYMVAEDLCSSLEALLHGWNVKFATQIYGNEEFPINAKALMIRSAKFCSANFQFFRVYWRKLLKTRLLTVLQKLDLLSFTLSVPLFALMYLSLVLCSIIFPLNDIPTGYNDLMILPTIICYFSQTIADGVFEHENGMHLWGVIKYELCAMLLYGSFYYLTVKCTVLALFGHKAKFNVTPKNNKKITFKHAFLDNIQTITFSVLTIVIVLICSRSSWILLSFLPGCLGWILSLRANHISKQDKEKQKRFALYDKLALHDSYHRPLHWNE